MDWIAYSTPLSAAKAYMDPEMANDPVCYPSSELLGYGTSYDALPASVSRYIESLFLKARIS